MGYSRYSYFRSCLDEEEDELQQERRLFNLGRAVFHHLDCLIDVPLMNMIRFIRSTGSVIGTLEGKYSLFMENGTPNEIAKFLANHVTKPIYNIIFKYIIG